MPAVKVRIYRRSAHVLDPKQVIVMIDEVQQETNAFLATLDINNVCDVRERLETAGKYAAFTTFFITIYYLE